MKRVTGIGGIFFKAQDPKKLQTWYQEHLGLPAAEHGSVIFKWQELDEPNDEASTVWSPFPASTRYFDPSTATFMINYRVADLDALLAQLRSEGIEVDDRPEDSEYGRFAWIMDPEGNRIELWQPPNPK
jgi:catechol 2,3-dioxygenase-like lactoylglutathione lyase family enzyme